MKIVFMGTPDFAEKSLSALYNAGYDITAVFTQPDKPKNRGMKLAMSPVKELALAHDTPVYQPDTLRDGTAFEIMSELQPDLICAVAYGKILPVDILNIPRFGCVNIHGSILPKYRGAAPMQWTVLNGDSEAGVTAMYMAEGMDTGDIIAVKRTPVGEYETSGELFDRLAVMGGELLTETAAAIENGTVRRTPQSEQDATYAPPLDRSICPIDWSASAAEIINKVRGLNPWPTATANIASVDFKIHRAVRGKSEKTAECGTILAADKNGIEIACADGSVIITELQAAGGRRMPAADYLRGHPIVL